MRCLLTNCFCFLFLLKLICFRYEQLIDLCLRFTEVTHACYYDVISPIVIHAQSQLEKRILEFSGTPHPQSHMLEAAKKLGKSKVENRLEI